MTSKQVFAATAVLALLAGGLAWWLMRPASSRQAPAASTVSPAALYAAAFRDTQGASQSLARFERDVVVLNFWATWCAPCREEMPAFQRVQARWAGRGVQVVGISAEEPEVVARFAGPLGITYPLWVGEAEVGELSRRLGNRLGVLPHTVILKPGGAVAESRVGTYTESELEARVRELAPKR